ncbi:MAG TPA: hypothetical protein DHW82_04465 [Spirochaetia bacterium]|nr:MAG: hypothetical protein A2Y41_10745 [Spirochaetes bacterium GWB1_36_13]HCL56247.1 hypothetical protein [Spirochaetia bacterium]
MKPLKMTAILILMTGILSAGAIQDELTDTVLQDTYSIKDGSVISASNLRNLFLKLAAGSWTKAEGSSNIYYDKGSIAVGGYDRGFVSNINAFSFEMGGLDPTQSNGKAVFYLHDWNRVAHQLRYTNGTLFLEATTNGYGTTNTPNFSIGGSLFAAVNGGNVGIGTSSPEVKLDVKGLIQSSNNIIVNDESVNGDANIGLVFQEKNISKWFWYKGDQHHLVLKNFSNDSYPIIVDPSAGTHILSLNQFGLGIGNYSNGEMLEVYGNIKATGTITPSDFRYKKNIHTLEHALEKLLSLRGVSFEWKTEEYQEKNFSKGTNIGLIAQEAEKIVPEVVNTGKDGYKAMAYSNLSALIVEAVKELKKLHDEKIEKLEKEILEIKKENESLRVQNEELMKIVKSYDSKMDKINSLLGELNQKKILK